MRSRAADGQSTAAHMDVLSVRDGDGDDISTYNDSYVAAFPLMLEHVVYPLAHEALRRVTASPTLLQRLHDTGRYDWCSLEKGYFLRAAALFASGVPEDALVCALLATSWLERGLANVYQSVAHRKPPPLFHDLVESDHMVTAFGPSRELVRAFLVHPWGINLRNVLWHGFVAAPELPREWVALLLLLCAALSQRVDRATFRQHRLAPLRVTHIWCGVPAALTQFAEADFAMLITDNAMVPRGYETALLAAFRRLRDGNNDGLARLEALCLLVTSLEHALRRVYW